MIPPPNKRQNDFRKGCSTEAALHKEAHQIERREAKKGSVLGGGGHLSGKLDHQHGHQPIHNHQPQKRLQTHPYQARMPPRGNIITIPLESGD